MKNVILIGSILVGLTACNNHSASEKEVTMSQSKQITTANDDEFMNEATEGSMLEVALGRFASGHASDQRLKDYGYKMIEDHEQLLRQIKQMAATHNVKLPDTVNAGHQRLIDYLAPKGGNPFDSTYMAEMISHQKKLAAQYDKAVNSSEDPEVKTYAKETIPLIMSHLLELITLRDSINIKKQPRH